MKIFIFIICFFIFFSIFSQDTRPIRDDIGYCWQPDQFNRLIKFLKPNERGQFNHLKLIAGISPHDDYLYAAQVYYPLFKNINTKEVIIFGVTHSTVRKKIGNPQNKLIFDDFRFWSGPEHKVQISPLREFLKKKMTGKYFLTSNLAHLLEHSIEATIPFLQHFNPGIKITPIMVTGMPFEEMEKISDEISQFISIYIRQNHLHLGRDIFFLISSDANHYGQDFNNTCFGQDARAHQLATAQDIKIARTYLSGHISKAKIKGLTRSLWGKTYQDYNNTLWCGKYSLPFGMMTILKVVENIHRKGILRGKIFCYSDTYSNGVLPIKKTGCGITAPFSLKHWVGYFSAGFFLNKN
ncbi:MAG: AmmeMemoRadiSam system protein B [Candidatus Aminicenantes bacterium]|nr:AmmeMemoRadiSam system protein B [Candidatus Aminicenantes bacterium]